MKVLITGGMGVIGAETSRKFVNEGHRPVIFARHRDDSLIGDILDKIDFEQGDVLDMPRVLQAIKKHKVTHVVHAAAFVGAVSADNPALSIQVNVMGLVNVLEAARALDVQARGVHQRQGRLWPGHRRIRLADLEADVRRPAGQAEAHLRFGEIHGRERLPLLQRQHGPRHRVAALRRTYGPGKTARHGPMAVMSRIVENPAHGLPFKLEHGGDDKDDFIYNKDSAHGIFLATMAEQAQKPPVQHRHRHRASR